MDGVHVLKTREKTRLWYRQPARPALLAPPAATAEPVQRTVAAVEEPAKLGAAESNEALWAELLSGALDDDAIARDASPAALTAEQVYVDFAALSPAAATAPLRLAAAEARKLTTIAAPAPAASAPTAAATAEREPASRWDEWRVAPDSSPSLLLSATDLLDARDPGAVLRPGARYRVVSIQNGVVGLDVVEPDGTRGIGYCASVDLICIDPRFGILRPGRKIGTAKLSLRTTVQRMTGGLSQATTSLLGAAASNGTRSV